MLSLFAKFIYAVPPTGTCCFHQSDKNSTVPSYWKVGAFQTSLQYHDIHRKGDGLVLWHSFFPLHRELQPESILDHHAICERSNIWIMPKQIYWDFELNRNPQYDMSARKADVGLHQQNIVVQIAGTNSLFFPYCFELFLSIVVCSSHHDVLRKIWTKWNWFSEEHLRVNWWTEMIFYEKDNKGIEKRRLP